MTAPSAAAASGHRISTGTGSGKTSLATSAITPGAATTPSSDADQADREQLGEQVRRGAPATPTAQPRQSQLRASVSVADTSTIQSTMASRTASWAISTPHRGAGLAALVAGPLGEEVDVGLERHPGQLVVRDRGPLVECLHLRPDLSSVSTSTTSRSIGQTADAVGRNHRRPSSPGSVSGTVSQSSVTV